MLSRVDRYVAGKVAVPLVAAFGIALVFMLADRVVGLLDNTMGKGNVVSSVFQMLAYLVPHYFGQALPFALFIGVLLGVNRMSQDNELDAFQAAGIGLHRVSLPIFLLSLISLAASAATLGWLQPHSRYAYRQVIHTLQNVEVFYLAEEGIFMQSGKITFIFDALDRQGSRVKHVFLYEDRGPGGGASVLTAREGQLVQVEDQIRPVLQLKDGLYMRLRPDNPSSEAPMQRDISRFQSAQRPIGREGDDVFRARGEDERELTLPELHAQLATPPPGSTVAAMQAELNNRLVKILTIPLLPILAIPFALSRRRSMRAYSMGIALVLLFAFQHIIEQGTIATRSSSVSPWISIWLPFGLFASFAMWRFWRACFSVPSHDGRNFLNSLDGLLAALRQRLPWLNERAARIKG